MVAVARLKFEADIHFEAATDEAVIWADGRNGDRFKLVITRDFLQKIGLKKRFNEVGARALLEKNRDVLKRLAQGAYDQGDLELTL